MSKIRKPIAIAAAAAFFSVGAAFASPMAYSAGDESSPCVVAVHNDNSAYSSERGVCDPAFVEETKVTTATANGTTYTSPPVYVDSQTPPPALPVGFIMTNNFQASDVNGDPLPYHIKAVNTQSGQTVHDASYQVGQAASFDEYFNVPVDQVDTAPRPEYLVTVTVDSVERSYTITADKWVENNGGYEIHLDAFLENGTFRLQYPPATGESSNAETVTFFMANKLIIDFDRDGSPDQGFPYHLEVVNLTSNQLIYNQSGTGTGTTELEDIVAYPADQIPVYQFTVTGPGGTFSYTTNASDYAAGNAGSQQMSWVTYLTPEGFTHQPNAFNG